MRIVLHPEAEREFTAAALYYERQRPGLGTDFLAEFDAAVLDEPSIRRKVGRVLRTSRRPTAAALERFDNVVRPPATMIATLGRKTPARSRNPTSRVPAFSYHRFNPVLNPLPSRIRSSP